jgi:polar amino acid transport system permease protein
LQVGNSRLLPITNRLSRLPWWALIAALLGVLFLWVVSTSSTYQDVWQYVVQGIEITVRITLIAYTFALMLGLIVALGRISNNMVVYQAATFYVEIVRGLPTLVLLFYIAYVGTPQFALFISGIGSKMVTANFLPDLGTGLAALHTSDITFEARVIVALVIAYSAFLAEIFRAGIESVEPGQMEAARSLGMTYWQAMRFIILRQAIRQVLPPLGNDFISMLKDSSLASALPVYEITNRAGTYAKNHFLFFEAYNVLAFLYLVMTLLLSMVVRFIERSMARERQRSGPSVH